MHCTPVLINEVLARDYFETQSVIDICLVEKMFAFSESGKLKY